MWAKPPIETVASVEEQRSRPARPRVVRRDSCWRARGGAPFRWMGAAIGRPRRRSTLAVAGRRIRRRRRRAGLCSARCAGRRRVLRRSSGRRRGARRRSRTRGRRGRPSAGVHRRAGAPSRGRRIGPPRGVWPVVRTARAVARARLTPKRPARRIRVQVSELRAGENDTRGGSSETDASEFTISPAGSPPGAAVTKATPVANLARASRNERGSDAGAGWAGAASAISGATALRPEQRGRGSRRRGWRRAGA
jgi:hypothetical protein